MNLGNCQSCRQRAELHEDVDKRLVCEDCLMGKSPLGKEVQRKIKEGGAPQEVSQPATPRRELLLDFIAANAPDDWVRDLIAANVEEYKKKLQDFGWLEIMEKNPERALLRIATKMGYKEATPQPSRKKNVFLKKKGRKNAKSKKVLESITELTPTVTPTVPGPVRSKK